MPDKTPSKKTIGTLSASIDTKTKRRLQKNDVLRDAAALLFAELFYRQVMEERNAKLKHDKIKKKIDKEPL